MELIVMCMFKTLLVQSRTARHYLCHAVHYTVWPQDTKGTTKLQLIKPQTARNDLDMTNSAFTTLKVHLYLNEVNNDI